MAENNVTTSDEADMTDCDGGKVVTMMDVLQEQEAFEEDANAVLGASDDKNCTYPKGYVKRQAIYSCLTCCPDAKDDSAKRAGVCLACSLHCHESHELVELYTKRLFRCDCGNSKFNGHPCSFTPNKTDLNWDNKYNQNFSGVYCVCHRPYPDPDAVEEEEMIQCIVCEDWLHSNHLEATLPLNDQYGEMICKGCMEENDFLHDYSELIVNVADKEVEVYDPDLDVSTLMMEALKKKKVTNRDSTEKGDVITSTEEKAGETTTNGEATMSDTEQASITTNPETKDNQGNVGDTEKKEEKLEPASENNATDTKEPDNKTEEGPEESAVEEKLLQTETESAREEKVADDKGEAEKAATETDKAKDEEPNHQENKRKLSTEEADDDATAKKQKIDDKNKCTRPRGVKRCYKGATFWPGNFRQKLCTCGECLDMYKDLAVLFLTDLDDTVTAYEALGKERVEGPSSQYEKGLQALSSLDRVQQINALTEYNRMRDKLLDFLKSFKERREVVKEEDIKEFFAGMKPQRESDGGVYFCR